MLVTCRSQCPLCPNFSLHGSSPVLGLLRAWLWRSHHPACPCQPGNLFLVQVPHQCPVRYPPCTALRAFLPCRPLVLLSSPPHVASVPSTPNSQAGACWVRRCEVKWAVPLPCPSVCLPASPSLQRFRQCPRDSRALSPPLNSAFLWLAPLWARFSYCDSKTAADCSTLATSQLGPVERRDSSWQFQPNSRPLTGSRGCPEPAPDLLGGHSPGTQGAWSGGWGQVYPNHKDRGKWVGPQEKWGSARRREKKHCVRKTLSFHFRALPTNINREHHVPIWRNRIFVATKFSLIRI